MDGAATFLHRRERNRIEKRRKGEPLRALVPVVVAEVPGLLAVTPTRLLHAAGRRRIRLEQWHQKQVLSIHFEQARYGILHVVLRQGGRRRFELMDRADLALLEAALRPAAPAQAAARPSAHAVRRPPQGASQRRAHPSPDPLAHQATPEHAAKLRRMVAQGVLSQGELEWARR